MIKETVQGFLGRAPQRWFKMAPARKESGTTMSVGGAGMHRQPSRGWTNYFGGGRGTTDANYPHSVFAGSWPIELAERKKPRGPLLRARGCSKKTRGYGRGGDRCRLWKSDLKNSVEKSARK